LKQIKKEEDTFREDSDQIQKRIYLKSDGK